MNAHSSQANDRTGCLSSHWLYPLKQFIEALWRSPLPTVLTFDFETTPVTLPLVLITESAAGGAPSTGPYLVDGTIAGLSGYVNTRLLAADLTIKGNASAARTITFGQQVTNPDIVNLDTINANARVNGSEIVTVGAVQTFTGAHTFNDQTIKLRNPGNTFSYTLVHGAVTAARNLSVPLLTADDTIAVLAEAQTFTNKTHGAGTVFSVSPTINDGIKFTFNPSATAAGMNVGGHSADPSTLADWDMWGNDTDKKLRVRVNGVTYDILGGSGGGAPVDATYLVTSANVTLTNEVVVGSLTAALAIKGNDAAGRTITLGQQVTNADTVAIDVPVANCTINGVAAVNISATQTLTNKTLSTATAVTASISWGSGVKQTFTPSATTAGVNIGSVAGDPSTPANGDLWYNTTTNKYRGYENGVLVDIRVGSGSGGTLDQAYDYGGAGAGRAITADTGAVTITVPIAANNRCLELTQNDTTNNPACLGLANAGTGSHITVTSSDQDLRLSANGAGLISLDSSTKLTNQKELRLMELTTNGTNYVAFRGAASLSGSTTWTLPTADGTANQVLATDGSAVLSWASIAASWINDTFTGDSSTTVFTLSATPSDNDGVIVSEDGSIQVQGGGNSYTVAGTALTFVVAPATGVTIQAKYMTGGITGTSHPLLGATHTDTLVGTVVRGDLIVGNSTPNWARLALGAADFAPVSNGADLVYRKVASDVILFVNYPGSAWTDFGDASPMSLSTGTLKEDHDSSVTGGRNYLHAESSAGSLEVFSHVIQYRMPPSWRGWAATAMRFTALTETTSALDQKIDVFVYNSAGTQIATKAAQVSSSAGVWFNIDLLNTDFTALPAADATIRIRIKAYSKSGNHCRFGEITMFIGSNT